MRAQCYINVSLDWDMHAVSTSWFKDDPFITFFILTHIITHITLTKERHSLMYVRFSCWVMIGERGEHEHLTTKYTQEVTISHISPIMEVLRIHRGRVSSCGRWRIPVMNSEWDEWILPVMSFTYICKHIAYTQKYITQTFPNQIVQKALSSVEF